MGEHEREEARAQKPVSGRCGQWRWEGGLPNSIISSRHPKGKPQVASSEDQAHAKRRTQFKKKRTKREIGNGKTSRGQSKRKLETSSESPSE